MGHPENMGELTKESVRELLVIARVNEWEEIVFDARIELQRRRANKQLEE